MNIKNKNKYEEYKQFHTNDGGKHPEAYAVTELIKQSILNKDYKIYYGGGYEANTENPIDIYDVVVIFSWGGDPTFKMCMSNEEGDSCTLVSSNPKAECITVEV